MSREWKQRIQEILDAIREIESFTVGMNYDSFRADTKTIKAVVMNFAVIGEAVTHIDPDILKNNPHIPWQLMRGMRNRLIHAYFQIDPEIVWATIRNDLPSLVEPLQQMLKSGA